MKFLNEPPIFSGRPIIKKCRPIPDAKVSWSDSESTSRPIPETVGGSLALANRDAETSIQTTLLKPPNPPHLPHLPQQLDLALNGAVAVDGV
jgi:hypothetical protein